METWKAIFLSFFRAIVMNATYIAASVPFPSLPFPSLPLTSPSLRDRLRCIPLLQLPNLLIRQLQLDGLHGLVNPFFTAQTDDGIHPLLAQTPRCRHGRHGHTPLLRNLFHSVDDGVVGFRLVGADQCIEVFVRSLAEGGA